MNRAARDGETVFALATGGRKAALAIFRISGPNVCEALKVLTATQAPPVRRATLRTIRDPGTGEAIDRSIITRFEGPASFTGEDVAELGVTGGRAVITAVARALAAIPGLRPAEPGEFAMRAFLNGKLDLSSVEGLADLVDAETEQQRRQAQRIADGALRRECEEIRSLLLSAMVEIEGQIDFSDAEDSGELSIEGAEDLIKSAQRRLEIALDTAAQAQRVRDGFVVVIAGPPNVGKSTLMNAIAQREISITSPTAGTTRDLIETFLDLGGLPVVFVDTAGIRESVDPIEQVGVAKARRKAASADLTLWLTDPDDAGHAVACPTLTNVLEVETKADLLRSEGCCIRAGSGKMMRVSAVTGLGIKELLAAVRDRAESELGSSETGVLILERHRRAFVEARESLGRTAEHLGELELVAEDVRCAVVAVDRVVGRIDVEDVLEGIFSRMCIGK
jgi:tRNA modification GTPase